MVEKRESRDKETRRAAAEVFVKGVVQKELREERMRVTAPPRVWSLLLLGAYPINKS